MTICSEVKGDESNNGENGKGEDDSGLHGQYANMHWGVATVRLIQLLLEISTCEG